MLTTVEVMTEPLRATPTEIVDCGRRQPWSTSSSASSPIPCTSYVPVSCTRVAVHPAYQPSVVSNARRAAARDRETSTVCTADRCARPWNVRTSAA